jgi:hypothetical protein
LMAHNPRSGGGFNRALHFPADMIRSPALWWFGQGAGAPELSCRDANARQDHGPC